MTKVKTETSVGIIVIELDDENAPISAQNFLQYVDDKRYQRFPNPHNA